MAISGSAIMAEGAITVEQVEYLVESVRVWNGFLLFYTAVFLIVCIYKFISIFF